MPGYIESCGVPPSWFPGISSLHFLLHDNEVREFSTELLGRQAGAFWKENDVIVVFPLGVRDMNPLWLSLFHRMPSKIPEQVSASSPAVSLLSWSVAEHFCAVSVSEYSHLVAACVVVWSRLCRLPPEKAALGLCHSSLGSTGALGLALNSDVRPGISFQSLPSLRMLVSLDSCHRQVLYFMLGAHISPNPESVIFSVGPLALFLCCL